MNTIQCLKPIHSGKPHKTHGISDLNNFTHKLEQGYEGDLKYLENNVVTLRSPHCSPSAYMMPSKSIKLRIVGK